LLLLHLSHPDFGCHFQLALLLVLGLLTAIAQICTEVSHKRAGIKVFVLGVVPAISFFFFNCAVFVHYSLIETNCNVTETFPVGTFETQNKVVQINILS
jgi:hypothetical protein